MAKQYDTTWGAVERGIWRTAVQVWENAPDRLEALSRRPLTAKPKPAKFLALLTAYYTANQAA